MLVVSRVVMVGLQRGKEWCARRGALKLALTKSYISLQKSSDNVALSPTREPSHKSNYILHKSKKKSKKNSIVNRVGID